MTVTGSEIRVEIEGRDVGLAALLTKVDQQTRKTADDALRLQQQYARLAAASGNTAGATSILSNALLNNAGASEKALVSTATQLEKLQSGSTIVKQFGDAAKSSLLGVIGPAAAAGAAFTAVTSIVQSFVDAFKFKAELDAVNQGITTNIGTVRDSGRVFAEAAQFAERYRLTQKETADILAASTDTLRTSTASVGELEAALLRLQSRDVSKPISEAARALRELQSGDVTSIKELFNVPAREANRMKNEIAAGGDAVQVLSGYLDRAGVSMDVLANRSKGAAGALNEAAIAAENLKLAEANIAQSAGGVAVVQEQARVYQGLANLLNGQVIGGLRGTANEITALIVKYQAHTLAIQNGATEAQAAAIAEQTYTASLAGASQAAAGGVGANNANAASLIHVGDAAAYAVHQLQALDDQSKISAGHRAALLPDARKAGLAALRSGSATTKEDIAESQARADARQRAIDQAHADRIDRTGTATQRLAQRQLEYDAAVRKSGISSAEAYAAETKLIEARQQAARGGGGGGGVKLSAQQKLNNALLSDQEKYEERYDDLDAQHQQKRLDILQDYYEKVRDATRNFEQDQLEGRAGFYDQLGGIENQKIAKAASAAYEQAAVEASKIAQEKGADVADKYMQAQEQVISARAKRQAEIEKAAKEGEKGRAEYLKGVDAQYRAAEDAKIARIQEGEGSLAAQRDKQLADENRAYEAQSGKLADHAEASADRRVAAAQRAGQAIDAEAAKAAGLASTYDKIAPAGPGAQSAAATPTAAEPGISLANVVSKLDELRAAIVDAERAGAEKVAGAVKQIRATGGVAG